MRLKDENRQLKSQLETLRSQAQRHQADKQAIIDRYERVLAELQQAAATAPKNKTTTQRTASFAGRTQTGGLIQQLQQWL